MSTEEFDPSSIPPAGLSEDAVDLASRGNNGIRWLTRHLQHFSPVVVAPGKRLRVKEFGELAILYAHLKNLDGRPAVQGLSLSEFLPAWEEFLWNECQSSDYADLARKHLAEGVDTLVPYLMLRATGYRDDYHEETLALLRRMGFPEAAERAPSHAIFKYYFLWKSGLASEEPDWNQLYRQTLLANARTLIYLDASDAYSITHLIMYLTDFGLRPPPFDATETARVIDLIECLVINYWRIGHWDLLGELLMSLAILGACNTAAYLGAKQALHAVWKNDGSLPAWDAPLKDGDSQGSSHIDAEPLGGERGVGVEPAGGTALEDEILADFKLHYHSTIVGVFYCTASLLHPRSE